MRKYIILRKQEPSRGANNLRQVDADSGVRSPIFTYERLTDRAAASIAAEPEVEAVAAAMATRLIRPMDAENTDSSNVWGLDAVGARNSTYSGRGVTVAVLDTGIDVSHPAFADAEVEQRDFSGDGDGDGAGHGTHCAGTLFGRDVGGIRIGVAPGVERALIGKVLGNDGCGDSQMIIEGVQWALSRGANIISMSLGFDFPGMVEEWINEGWPAELATSKALEAYRVNLRVFDALMNLTNARGGFGGGTLVVAAAGNESKRDHHPQWKIATSLPAAADGIISVAAVGNLGERLGVANFSNSGALVSGPGVSIVSAKVGGGLHALSGTSMACPHVAGLAALWWEAIRKSGRTPTPTNVRAELISHARRDVFGEDGTEADIGQGLVTAP